MSESNEHTYGGVFQGRRSLVTGGAGFIGSHITARLLSLGSSVVILDDLSSGHQHNVPQDAVKTGRLVFERGTVLDEGLLARAVAGCDYVFHQAAMVSVPQSVAQPGDCMMVNVVGTQRVLAAAAKAGARRVMFAASAAAYGNNPKLPSRETDLPDSWSPYAASKITGELLLQTHARCFSLSTVSLRYFNVFGPRQDPKSAYAAAISAFADALIAGRRPKIFGDGQQTRDFVPVENIVHANLLAASCPKPLAGEVVNIGCAGRVRLLDVLTEMGKAMGVSVDPEFHPPRAGDVRDSSADISRAKDLLGYAPIVPFSEGIRRTLGWMREAR